MADITVTCQWVIIVINILLEFNISKYYYVVCILNDVYIVYILLLE